ncbi:MAG: hypothetical protein JNL92_24615 [Opitutaceae bacterium]|nr:hypothetical protein [Opitutaceae bacterium]
MNSPRALCLAVLAASMPWVAFAAEEPEAPKTSMKSVLKARIAEDARKAEAKNAAPKKAPVSASNPAPTAPAASTSTAPSPATAPATSDATARKETAKEPATVLPKVEVKKSRITVLDQQLAKQEEDIARERKNLKASEVDVALNDAKIAAPLAIFGGESSQFRQRVASERVQLMEAEKDIIEAMARARTKQERAELQKQLDEIRGFRRELDKTLR